MNLENYFISKFHNKHIGDDGVVIDGGCVYSKDAFFEDVHFKKEWLGYYDIAKRAMLVNISDAIAMHANPKYALLSVAMPKSMSKKDIDALAKGFSDTAKEFGVEIIGGDTISNMKLDITITIISETKKPLLRKGLRHRYLLAYTGMLGNSYKELKKLQNRGKIHNRSKFIDIKLREDFVKRAYRHLKVGMDISDGLFDDTQKMLMFNKMGAVFLRNIPKRVGCSGEEYEMLVGFDPRKLKALKRVAQLSRTKLTVFAKVARNRVKHRCKNHHF
ncbi:MAG: thiamine-phosphate kinase [Epsilonproteobacteria bacterium]|nr:thiamine-phosphate kinase [Campylobacterota bacterium]